jgi:hypothetical protein
LLGQPPRRVDQLQGTWHDGRRSDWPQRQTQEKTTMGILSTGVEVNEAHFTTPFPPEVYGLGAFAGLMMLLAVTFAFRSVAKRHGHTER